MKFFVNLLWFIILLPYRFSCYIINVLEILCKRKALFNEYWIHSENMTSTSNIAVNVLPRFSKSKVSTTKKWGFISPNFPFFVVGYDRWERDQFDPAQHWENDKISISFAAGRRIVTAWAVCLTRCPALLASRKHTYTLRRWDGSVKKLLEKIGKFFFNFIFK